MTENPEIILNLWYVYDDLGVIYSLRGRCYIGTGTDDEKLALLRRFATTDYMIARVFPVPERLHTTFVEGDEKRTMAVVCLDSLEALGGVEVLFEEVYQQLERDLPSTTRLDIGRDPLICITPLLGNDENELFPQTQRRGRL